jgi:SAM-dependent methyltransferase
MLDVSRLTRDTYEQIAEQYCATTPSAAVRSTILHSARLFLEELSGPASVLVLGAGDGRDAEYFRSHECRVVCVDYCAAMNRLALRRLQQRVVVAGELTALPVADRSFGGVWASACLYHLPKTHLETALREVRRCLKPSGVFYLNLRRGSGERVEPNPRSFPHGGPRYYAYYSRRDVRRLLEPFSIKRFWSTDPVLGTDYVQVIARSRP